MRKLMLVAAAVLCLGGGAVHADDADRILGSCAVTTHEGLCKAVVTSLRDDWRKANRGDYQGQRNVAFCLSTGCDGAAMVDEVQGCAWRIVIMGSDADIDQTDVSNYRNFCQHKLTRDQQADARLMAGRLFKKIYKRKLTWSPND